MLSTTSRRLTPSARGPSTTSSVSQNNYWLQSAGAVGRGSSVRGCVGLTRKATRREPPIVKHVEHRAPLLARGRPPAPRTKAFRREKGRRGGDAGALNWSLHLAEASFCGRGYSCGTSKAKPEVKIHRAFRRSAIGRSRHEFTQSIVVITRKTSRPMNDERRR